MRLSKRVVPVAWIAVQVAPIEFPAPDVHPFREIRPFFTGMFVLYRVHSPLE